MSLSVEERRDLYAMIARRLRATGRWRRTGDRLRLTGSVPVEIDPDLVGGEPVSKGTRVPVRHIGLLTREGVSLAEILEDYPALDEQDVAFARLFIELRRDPGRPRKPLAFARAG